MLLILFAYARREHLPLLWYALINLAGSSLLGVVCLVEETWSILALQVAWGVVAVRDLVTVARGVGAKKS
jgi:hypothetical protein